MTLSRMLTAALVAAAVAAPTATAQPVDVDPVARAHPSQDLRSPDARDAAIARKHYDRSYGAKADGPAQDLRSPDARDAARQVTQQDNHRRITYQNLRNPDARAVANARAQERYHSSYGEPEPLARDAARQVTQRDSHGQVSYTDPRSPDARLQDLRSPDTREAALAQEQYFSSYGEPEPLTPPQPVASPSVGDGFDWPSAAIGAAAGTGALLLLLAAMTGTRWIARRPA